MGLRWSIALLLLEGIASAAGAEDWAQEMFQTARHDFGTIAAGSKAEFSFVMTNIYQTDVHVVDVRSSCGCTTPRIAKEWLKTYEQGAIVAAINSDTFRGQRAATLTVTIDKPWYATAQLSVSVHIRSDVECDPASANFGTLDAGRAAEARIAVTRWNDSDWKITQVRSDNPHLSASATETTRDYRQVAYQLRVKLDGKAPPGHFLDRLLLVTNDAQATQIPVTVEGQILGKVSVNPSSLFLGVLKPGQKVTKQIVVRAKQPLRITGVQTDRKSIEYTLPGAGTAKPLQLVPVTFVAGADRGKVEKKIIIQTDLDATPLEVTAFAVVND